MPESSAETVRFRSLTAKELVYTGNPTSGSTQLYYCPVGQQAVPAGLVFFELKIRAFAGNATHHEMVVDDPSHGFLFEKLVREGRYVRYRDEIYRLKEPTIDLSEVTVVPLPL